MKTSANSILEQQLDATLTELKKQGFSDKDCQKFLKTVRKKMKDELDTPPKIALLGLTGVGKSSTINALFNAGRPVSHSVPCTQSAEAVIVSTNKGKLEIYDMPGLGEGIKKDEEHLKTYKQIIPNIDVVLWIINTRTEYTYFQICLKKILPTDIQEQKQFLKKMVFAINKVDLFNSSENLNDNSYENQWNTTVNLPGVVQQKHIQEFADNTLEIIHDVAPDWSGTICAYSAAKRYHLEELMLEILSHIELKYAWKLSDLADIADFRELLPPDVRAQLASMEQE